MIIQEILPLRPNMKTSNVLNLKMKKMMMTNNRREKKTNIHGSHPNLQQFRKLWRTLLYKVSWRNTYTKIKSLMTNFEGGFCSLLRKTLFCLRFLVLSIYQTSVTDFLLIMTPISTILPFIKTSLLIVIKYSPYTNLVNQSVEKVS